MSVFIPRVSEKVKAVKSYRWLTRMLECLGVAEYHGLKACKEYMDRWFENEDTGK